MTLPFELVEGAQINHWWFVGREAISSWFSGYWAMGRAKELSKDVWEKAADLFKPGKSCKSCEYLKILISTCDKDTNTNQAGMEISATAVNKSVWVAKKSQFQRKYRLICGKKKQKKQRRVAVSIRRHLNINGQQSRGARKGKRFLVPTPQICPPTIRQRAPGRASKLL